MADKPSFSLPHSSTKFDKEKGTTAADTSQSSHFSFSCPFSPLRQHNTTNTMASQAHPQQLSHATMNAGNRPKDSNKFDINSLMSPPDPVLDSFNPDGLQNVKMANRSSKSATASGQTKHPLPMSPPVSPYTKHVSAAAGNLSTTAAHSVNDPVLYPSEDAATTSPPQPPLFAPTELVDYQRIVDDYVRTRPASIFAGVSPPRREDYELILTFRSQVMKHYTANPKGWLRKERELLKADRRAGAQRYHAIMPAKPKPTLAAKPPRQRADRVSKPVQGSGASAPRGIRSGGAGLSASATPGKRSTSRASPTPEPSRRAVAPNREDKDFNLLPDYCPPMSSLPNKPNSLKVEWKGQPIDLSHDAYASHLHLDEVALAGNLRLDCATYLTSKRRIFERRLQCLRTGKEFRKTDAQQACKIDVNKASKLWTAFDKVGWLDAQWVRRFL